MVRIKILIICGGQSAEHEVSLRSAYNVAKAIDKSKYEITLVAIDKTGHWWLVDPLKFLGAESPKSIQSIKTNSQVSIAPTRGQLSNLATQQKLDQVDVVFPVLHGPNGEDGTVQGLLKLANLP